MKVLDKGFVELDNFMGGDLQVVNTAKVSNKKRSENIGVSERKLIYYLMQHRHGSPFEHSYFTFYVKAPLFVVREWQRHRIGSFNEMSGRYVEFDPEFYSPDRWRVPAATNKQGSVLPEPLDGWDEAVTQTFENMVGQSYTDYKYLISLGIAKEMARMVLPLSLFTEFYWTVNARSLMNFLSLRMGVDAQWEIRQYAEAIDKFFVEKMPITWAAWVENNSLAP
jgi:thymidylate synthase (FAD)